MLFSFIQPQSQFEINISSNQRNQFERKFTECTEEYTPITLFDELSIFIFVELERDNFRKFLTSEIWLKYIKKHTYLLKDILADEDDIAINQDGDQSQDSSHDSKDNNSKKIPSGFPATKNASISDEDFKLFLSLIHEEFWSILEKKQSFYVSISNQKLRCDGNLLPMIKEVGFLPFEASK